MAENRINTIYGLEATDDPGRIRYVGKTVGAIKCRLRIHRYDCKRPGYTSPACRWVADALARGADIKAVILQVEASDEDEAAWIAHYRGQGEGLLNAYSGGARGYKLDEAGCKRMSAAVKRVADAGGGGRLNRGSACGKSRLSEEQVHQIRAVYAAGGASFRRLAERYGVSAPSIRLVVKRLSWAHV
jgi:hypothetical protein